MAKLTNLSPHERFSFDPAAHEIVGNTIVAEEDNLIHNGVCKPHETDAYLSIEYIKQCGSLIRGSGVFVESDVYHGAGIFLQRLSLSCTRSLATKLSRHDRICSLQLQWHTPLYLRSFETKLYEIYLALLPTLPDVQAIDQNGILKLAAACLPNVKRDINRERRRRGAETDRLIVSNESVELRSALPNISPFRKNSTTGT